MKAPVCLKKRVSNAVLHMLGFDPVFIFGFGAVTAEGTLGMHDIGF